MSRSFAAARMAKAPGANGSDPGEELRRANRELEEFAFVASHDLREPLRMVNIYTQLLIEACGPAANDLARQFAHHIESNVSRMEQLIQDLLEYSHVRHEEHERALAPIPLARCWEQALSMFRDGLDAAGAKIETADLPLVLADETQIGQIFQNLLSNSLKYAHPERRLRIRVWAHRDAGWWNIHFADNGIGFEPQFCERIFGLFKRLHGREVPGTGLGLAISRRIVEQHGGTMRAQGRPQRGATFIFTLRGLNDDGTGAAHPAGRG